MKRKRKARPRLARSAPTIAHDRRVHDLGINAEVAAIEVDDPYATEAGERIVVLRQLRGDPLARLHTHGQIDQAQFLAGRAYQRDWEVAERGARAVDPTREAVDNSRVVDPLTDRQIRARARLAEIRRALGRKMHAVAHAVLIDGASIEAVARENGRDGESWLKYYGRFFRDALEALAVEYDLAGQAK
jgi:hypothetical protein